MDLERLDEALEQWTMRPPTPEPSEISEDYDERYLEWAEWQQIVVTAAEAYRNLLANGQRVEWCENHESSASSDGWFADGLRCHVWWWGEHTFEAPLLYPYDCRITSRLLSVYPKEAENG